MTRQEFLELIFTEIGCVRDSEHWARLYDDLTTPHWISVEDELPNEYNWVVCYLTIDGEMSVARYVNGHWWTDIGKAIDPLIITHWMPLPAPPKGCNNDNH